MKPVPSLVLAALCALVGLLGCSGGADDASEAVEGSDSSSDTPVAHLQDQVDQLRAEVRKLRKDVDQQKVQDQDFDRRLGQVRQDLLSRVTELLQEARTGRVRPQIRAARPPVRFEERPYMGFDGQDIEPEVAEHLGLKAKTGVLVTNVREDKPAHAAGLRKNDVVQGLGGKDVANFEQLKEALKGKKPGQVVTLDVLRGEEKLQLEITLGTRRVRVVGGED
ncbi:MAG: S1C family serine protease [Candidatus Brocadiia bacterium]